MDIRTIEDLRRFVKGVRFTPGHYVVGPEYAGCCGTGMRPFIYRCLLCNEPTLFLVGPKLVVEQMRGKIVLERNTGLRRFKYFEDDSKPDNRVVFVFKSKNNAVEKFLELSLAIMDWNRQQATEARDARAKLRANPMDMEAALKLGDMGLL